MIYGDSRSAQKFLLQKFVPQKMSPIPAHRM